MITFQVASSTWTTNMLRLDPTFNSDLPESKRWLKEYGARENEAFRFQEILLMFWLSRFCFGVFVKNVFCLFRKYPVPSKEADRRKALENATKFLVVWHPLDRLVSSYLDKVQHDDNDVDWRGQQKCCIHDLDFEYIGQHWQRNALLTDSIQVADTTKEPNLLKHRDVKNAILAQAKTILRKKIMLKKWTPIPLIKRNTYSVEKNFGKEQITFNPL